MRAEASQVLQFQGQPDSTQYLLMNISEGHAIAMNITQLRAQLLKEISGLKQSGTMYRMV